MPSPGSEVSAVSLHIDSLKDLQQLLKSCQLQIRSVEELEGLLARVNASYDPDEARVRAARRLGSLVPGLGAGAAFLTSFYLMPISLVALDRHAGVWERVTMCLGGLAIV